MAAAAADPEVQAWIRRLFNNASFSPRRQAGGPKDAGAAAAIIRDAPAADEDADALREDARSLLSEVAPYRPAGLGWLRVQRSRTAAPPPAPSKTVTHRRSAPLTLSRSRIVTPRRTAAAPAPSSSPRSAPSRSQSRFTMHNLLQGAVNAAMSAPVPRPIPARAPVRDSRSVSSRSVSRRPNRSEPPKPALASNQASGTGRNVGRWNFMFRRQRG